MNAAVPDPLVPSEVDLRGLPFMPLDTVRLLDSDIFALATGEEFKAAVALWCKAWQQVPAASLPDDDRILAHLSGTGARWRKVREMALHGFIKCSDGRLYHPLIGAKALDAWGHRLAQRDRAAKRWQSHGTAGASTNKSRGSATAYATAMQGRGRVKGQGEGQGQHEKRSAEVKPPGSKTPTTPTHIAPGSAKSADAPALTASTWDAYAQAYQARYGVSPVRNGKVNGQLAQLVQRLGKDEAPDVAAFYVRHQNALYVRSNHCVDLLLRDCEGLRTQWANGQTVTDTQARQADRKQSNLSVAEKLIAEARNAGN